MHANHRGELRARYLTAATEWPACWPAQESQRHRLVAARGIGLKLTSAAAKALNAALGTKLFSAGLHLGAARTLLRL